MSSHLSHSHLFTHSLRSAQKSVLTRERFCSIYTNAQVRPSAITVGDVYPPVLVSHYTHNYNNFIKTIVFRTALEIAHANAKHRPNEKGNCL